MAALPPVPGVVRCVVSGTLDGAEYVNVFHMGYTGQPPTGTQALALAGLMKNSWGLFMAPHLTAQSQMNLWEVFDLSSEVGASALVEGVVPGTATGGAVPNNVAMVISKAVARRYRGGHPRTYIGGCPISQQNDQRTWQPAFATTMGNAWADFIHDLTGNVDWPGVLEEVVVHYVKNHLPLPAPLVDATVGGVGRVVFGSMRKRLT